MRTPKVYKAKTLFDGSLIGKTAGKKYIAVPDTLKNNHIIAHYGNDVMMIPDWSEAETYRVFKDKFKDDKTYILGYFEFKGK